VSPDRSRFGAQARRLLGWGDRFVTANILDEVFDGQHGD
jgi:hypothetical protein